MSITVVTFPSVDTWYFLKNDRNRVLINRFPGPKCYPFLGTTLPFMFMTKPEVFTYIRSLPKKYGPLYRTWIGSSPVINLADPKYAEIILSNTTHISKGIVYSFVVPWLGDGLLTSEGTKWHRHRKLLTPAFHFKILESFVPIFVEKSKLLVDQLEKLADGKSAFNIFPYITHCTLDIIAESAMGIQVNAMNEDTNRYVEALYGLCREVNNRATKGWLRDDFIFYKTAYGKRFLEYLAVLHATTNGVIHERKGLLRKSNASDEKLIEDEFGVKKRKAFLDLLIDVSNDGAVLTHEQIREEVDTFMFEGHDTTTSSIAWTLFLLGIHQDIQEKAYKEVNEIFRDDLESLEFTDLNEFKYLERVLKESLRIYPSVATISRKASVDIKIEDYVIPKGTSVAMHILDIHRNPKYFANPEKFDPDRFLPENCKDRHPYAYIPFSAGPRNCIGQKFALMEEKILMSYILKNYKITSTQTVDNVHPVIESADVIRRSPINPIVRMRRLLETDLEGYYNISDENMTETCGVEHYLNLLHRYYIPVMIFVGLIGNFLSCLVFLTTYLNMRSSSYYLAALAIADIAYLLVLTMDNFNTTLLPDLYNRDGWCQAMIYISTVASSLSVWLIVAFTVERFIAIQYPLKRPMMCTVSRAKVIVIVLSTIAIFSHTYIFWTAGIEVNACSILPEHFAAMNIINALDSIFSLIIPFMLIVIMNVMIARSLFTFNKDMSDGGREERLSFEKSVDSKDSTKVGDSARMLTTPLYYLFNLFLSTFTFPNC
ncbi:hypothetical protein Trydic_g20100 [Trypoxylus dichotomus]